MGVAASTNNQLSRYTYDVAGNVINDGVGHAYVYNTENQLVTAGGVNRVTLQMQSAELVMNHQAAHAERCEQKEEYDVRGVRAVLHDAVAFFNCQREHQHHNDQVESLVHTRSFR
jgi:hypothetical protein